MFHYPLPIYRKHFFNVFKKFCAEVSAFLENIEGWLLLDQML